MPRQSSEPRLAPRCQACGHNLTAKSEIRMAVVTKRHTDKATGRVSTYGRREAVEVCPACALALPEPPTPGATR